MSNTSLSDISLPGRFRCTNVDCRGDAAVQLKRLGVCDGRSFEVMQPGDPMVLRVVGAQIGVSRKLASSVRVEPSPTAVAMAVGADVRTGEMDAIGLSSDVFDVDTEAMSHA